MYRNFARPKHQRYALRSSSKSKENKPNASDRSISSKSKRSPKVIRTSGLALEFLTKDVLIITSTNANDYTTQLSSSSSSYWCSISFVTRKATLLRSLATRPVGAARPLVHADLSTGKVNGPHRKKLRTYLGIVAHDKVDVAYENWKQALAADKDNVDDIICEKYDISKEKWVQLCQSHRDPSWEKQNTAPHVLSRGGYEYLEKKMMEEKKKKKLEEVAQSRSTYTMIDHPSSIRQHVKWKMARTKKTSQMMSEATKEIADMIGKDSLEEQTLQGSFVAHGRQDLLTAAIGRPEHLGHVRAAGVGVRIKQYFGPTLRTSRMSSSMAPEDLEQLTQKIRDQLEESITEKVTRQLMLSFSQMQSQFQSQMQSQGLALPPEPEVGPSTTRVSTKESCVDPSGNNPNTGDLEKYGLYVEENPLGLVVLGRLYEGSTIIHNIPLLHNQVKGTVGPTKPTNRPDHDVNDPLYLMTLTIPQLFLKSLQVKWDATVFGVFNDNSPLYIKHEDLSKIAPNGQCLSISVIQLWIMHMTETSMRAMNVDVYGFLEPQSIQRYRQSQFESESYIKNWMQKSKKDVPDNYLKGIINSALKGLDDTPQSKSKDAARQKGNTECGYYVMYWMSTIILGSFKNNWETIIYFNDVRPLEPERLKMFRIQWAKYYLKVKNET
ncbi:hypothetical protein HKD37_14G040920 [Glycine soja]